MDILAGLNPSQREAVEAIAGPLLIVAGPGSGKTRVITHRIAYLVKNCGVNPYNILAVTFTNKAAREMMDRLQVLIPGSADRITIGTFHAVCSRLLRREGPAIGLESSFTIYDEDDQTSLVRRILRELNLDEKMYQPRAILSHISAAKSELKSPLQYAEYATSYWEEVVLRIYRVYQEKLAENRALDFDDLLMTTVRLFRERPDVLEKYQSRYVHIMVDEFQDTNVAQYVIVKTLAGKHANICVVGDEDQSIYSWRQADIRNILNFETDFPRCRVVLLERNYRSTRTILDAARNVISANLMRKEKQLWTDNQLGLPITVFEAYDEQEEAGYVVDEIVRLVGRGEIRLRDCAVMYRANAQSRALETAFRRRNVPHKVVGQRFYERKEIKDVLAFLRVIHNPYDSVNLDRIINVPPRGIGARTLTELHRWSHQLGITVFEALKLVRGDSVAGAALGEDGLSSPTSPFNPRTERALVDFLSLLEGFFEASTRLDVLDLMELVLEKSGYAEYIRDSFEGGEDRWQNIMELATVARGYSQLEPRASLATFLEDAALATDVDEYDEALDAVTLITLHAAKGLEFPVVFIVGMEEGVCPHIRSFDSPERMEEERRLFYVGMTRAKQRLYLVHTFKRTLYGASNLNTPSRFLADIPPELVKGWREKTAASLPASPAEEPPVPPARPAISAKPALKSGDRVRHAKFGDGIVVSVQPSGDDYEVSVAFPEIGVKRLSLAFAPLEKIASD